MNKGIFIVVLLAVTSLITSLSSCEKEKIEAVDSNNNSNNNNDNNDSTNQQTTCFKAIDLSNHFSNIKNIDFINVKEGWVYGSVENSNDVTLMNSVDSGKTWVEMTTNMTVETTNIPFPYAKFINSTDGYLISEYNGAVWGKEIKYTIDKGQTWTVIPHSGNTTGKWDAFDFNSTEAAFIGHSDGILYFVSNSTHTITDSVTLPNQLDFLLKSDLSLSENGVLTTVVYRSNAQTDYKLEIAQSTNNGLNWTYTDIDLQYVYTVDFPDDNNGFITGDVDLDNSFLYKTTDGGLSWIKKNIPEHFVDVNFFNAQNGIALGAGKIYKTTDGAETWTEISCLVTSNSYPSDAVCYPSLNKWFTTGERTENNDGYAELYIYNE